MSERTNLSTAYSCRIITWFALVCMVLSNEVSTAPVPTKSVGPFGGQGGSPWNDEGYDSIIQFEIATGIYVDSLRVQYCKAGEVVWSKKHGGNGGGPKKTVKLDSPDEYITSISGFIDNRTRIIRSLTFQTNKRKLGPFGPEKGESFETPKNEGMVVGFFGRSDVYLDSIGVYMRPPCE